MSRHTPSPRSIVVVAAVLSLAACADQATGPTLRPSGPQLATAAAPGRYLVLANPSGFASSFASTVAALGGTIDSRHDGAGLAVVSGLSDAAAAQLASSSGISAVEADANIALSAPVAAVEADASDVAATDQINSVANPTTAARYSWQWNMRLIGAPTAWAAGQLGDAGVTVAILDTGIDYNSLDANGLVDLTRSTSFVPSDDALATTYFPTRNKSDDFNGHGTNVASQVSSKAVALAGVTSKTTLISVKVLGRTGSGTSAGVLNGVLWAADHGADVANMSLGGGFTKTGNGRFLSIINRVFAYANRKGMLVVVSAGNSAFDLDHDGNVEITYCNATHVVCVASVGPTLAPQAFPAITSSADQSAFYTNFGRSAISVASPGGNADAANGFTLSVWPWGNDIASWVWSMCAKNRIIGLTGTGAPILSSCVAGNRIIGFIGTSQASPHVAGLAAHLVALLGHGQPALIKARIQQSALDLGPVGVDPFYGFGRIDVAKALGL